MAASTFLVVWAFIFAAYVAIVGLCFLAIPSLKREFPEEFLAAGSPSPWTSPTIDLKFLGFLLKNQYLALEDARLKRQLTMLKYVWLAFFVLLALQFAGLAAGLGA